MVATVEVVARLLRSKLPTGYKISIGKTKQIAIKPSGEHSLIFWYSIDRKKTAIWNASKILKRLKTP